MNKLKLEINENLTLKQLDTSHAKELFLLTDRNRDHLREWLPWLDFTKSEKDSLKFIERTVSQAENNNGVQFGIWSDNELAGVIGHHGISWLNKHTSLGYWLAKDFGGRGIMTKACQRIIDYTFEELGLNLVSIEAATQNKASNKIPIKLGFHFEGCLRQREWLYEHFVDHHIYSITKDEWKEKI